MTHILWDASSLIKRYLIEVGSETVDTLWTDSRITSMALTNLGYVETAAILRRKYNSGILNQEAFFGARFLLQQDAFVDNKLEFLTTDDTILASIALIDRHSK